MGKASLLTIGQASRMLGVTEVTLRQWTDGGKVKAFITPGGHRRYSKGEILTLTGAHKRGIKEMIEMMELSPPLQLQIATGMIVVVMRVEDVGQIPTLYRQSLFYGSHLGGVDHRSFMGVPRMNQKTVVV